MHGLVAFQGHVGVAVLICESLGAPSASHEYMRARASKYLNGLVTFYGVLFNFFEVHRKAGHLLFCWLLFILSTSNKNHRCVFKMRTFVIQSRVINRRKVGHLSAEPGMPGVFFRNKTNLLQAFPETPIVFY